MDKQILEKLEKIDDHLCDLIVTLRIIGHAAKLYSPDIRIEAIRSNFGARTELPPIDKVTTRPVNVEVPDSKL